MSKGNTSASFRADGSFHHVKTPGLEISHGVRGYRRVETTRADSSRVSVGFFTPYPVYPSPAFWLTDYVIAQNYAEYQRMDDTRQMKPHALN